MGIYAIKGRFQTSLSPIESWLIRRDVHPDRITGAALVLSILGGAAFYLSGWNQWLLLLIPPIAIGRTALNALDGLVATNTGLARPWGEVLNEFSDRLADVALFAGLMLAPGVSFPLGVATIVLMLLGSYLGTVAKAAGGRREYGGVMGKADRMILIALFSVVAVIVGDASILNFYLWIVFAGLVVTICQRARKIHDGLKSVH